MTPRHLHCCADCNSCRIFLPEMITPTYGLGQSRILPRQRQSHGDSRCWTIARATKRHRSQMHIPHLLDCKAVCYVNQMLGISLPAVDFSLFFFLLLPPRHHQSRKLGRKFLLPVWHLHDIVPITSRAAQGAGDDTAANNLNRKCSNGPARRRDQLGANGTTDVSHACRRGICGLQTRVDKSRDYGDNTGLNDVSFFCKKNRTSPIQKFLNRLNCYCSSFTKHKEKNISNKRKIGRNTQKDT